MTKFNPQSDIPSLQSKVILITGGTAGLGSASISTLAQHGPAHIIFTGRNEAAAEKLITSVRSQSPEVRVSFLKCDLASLDSVASCAQQAKGITSRLDVIICNAGIMALPAAVSADGYEIQFATNHLGHALLIKLLKPLLQANQQSHGSQARVVILTSVAYDIAPSSGIEFDTLKSAQPKLGGMIPGPKWCRYGQSKLANLLYAEELARNHPEIMTVSVHPGFIDTGLFGGVDFWTALPVRMMAMAGRKWVSIEEGSFNQLWASTCATADLENGCYYEPVGQVVKKRKGNAANDKALAGRLWDWTEKELARFG